MEPLLTALRSTPVATKIPLANKYAYNCEPAEFFWSEAEKKRSVGGADKSCISVNKKIYLGTTYFADGFRLCAGVYQSYDVYIFA